MLFLSCEKLCFLKTLSQVDESENTVCVVVWTVKMEVFENNEACFSHVAHIESISLFILVCAFHFQSVVKDKCYFVQSSYYIAAKITENLPAHDVLLQIMRAIVF